MPNQQEPANKAKAYRFTATTGWLGEYGGAYIEGVNVKWGEE